MLTIHHPPHPPSFPPSLTGLAYALLASLPPIYGLYTATLPSMIYAIFGTSQHLAVGPVALVSIFYPRACAGLGLSTEGGSEELEARAALAPVLSFWVGIIFLLCGMLRISKVREESEGWERERMEARGEKR